MAGIPTESPLVLRDLWVPPTPALIERRTMLEALLSSYPPVGLLDARIYTMPNRKAIASPDLPRPERRGWRSPWGQSLARTTKIRNALRHRVPRAFLMHDASG